MSSDFWVRRYSPTAKSRRAVVMVTENPATILGLEGYGLAPGCFADLVVLQARDPVDAIRRRARRLQVLRRGRVVATTAPLETDLDLPGRPGRIDYGLD